MWLWLIQNILGSISLIIWPMIAVISAIVVIFFKIIESLPQFKMFSYLIKAIAIICFMAALFLWGAGGVNSIYISQIAEMKVKIADAEHKSQELNKQLEAKTAEKAKVIHEVHTVFKIKVKEIAAKIDQDCKVNRAAVEVLNNIVTGAKP
jgi:hypothetical protein